MITAAALMIEEKCREINRIAGDYQGREHILGSDLDEAELSTMEYYLLNPTATWRPEAIFRVCLLTAAQVAQPFVP
jgi:hypothetical protein